MPEQAIDQAVSSPANRVSELRDLPAGDASGDKRRHCLLIVDDDAQCREFTRHVLQSNELHCDQAADGTEGLDILRAKRYGVALLDVDMPGMTGTDLCRRLREEPPYPHLKIIMMSGRATGDELAKIMMAGADDYLTKPLSAVQLRARVEAALRLKDAQDRSDLLRRSLLELNRNLEGSLGDRETDLIHARNALVLALAELVSYRDKETGSHLFRLQHYCRTLAQEAARTPAFQLVIDDNFVSML